MDLLLLLSRLALAAVFLVAGVGKLADRAGSRQGMLDFGVPAALAPALALIVPLAEIAVAFALISASLALPAAAAALLILLVFIGAIAVSLAQGKRHECRCFGQIASAPIGRGTLTRNGLLAAVAAFILVAGLLRKGDSGPSLLALLGGLTGMEQIAVVLGVASLALLAGVLWLMTQMLGQNGRILARLDSLEERLTAAGSIVAGSANAVAEVPHSHDGQVVEDATPEVGLPIGTPAPAFQAEGLRGEFLTLDALLSGELPLLLLFTDPKCVPCNGLMPEIGRWQREQSDRLEVAVISRGSAADNRAKVAEHDLRNVLLQKNYEIADSFQAHGTPGAVLVNPDGTIGSGAALGADAIRLLVSRLTGIAPTAPPPPPSQVPLAPLSPAARLGEPAPTVSLPDLDGRSVGLADFKGSRTLMVFWNPGCGFCSQLLPELKEWEQRPPPTAPKLLLISTGTVEANREMGLRSTVLLDDDFRTGELFGASGTPIGLLLDEEGKVASQLAVGGVAVMSLANAPA